MPLPYGLNDGQLLAIINATREAVSRMKTVNAGVQDQADNYRHANDSDSGRVMQERLFIWNGEFNQIVNDLDGLNTRVINVRANDNATSADATGVAGHRD